ncbi:hypothetical protein [Methanococcoides burtonii]|uniref:Uncharacterized protein n=1 Tax=Methanococcoides burtonii (strain DSM 6242 / NBRC 107633 / OCM 468 / ACE-M) TaxID=259564 RepID=Q12XL9_METBU|nr:hypothetical protein [Methanococcoides burtonii]ABE51807.1 Hypothetical protein Mbur_0856 [Methanococcoides burtonii DSM 6242]
MEEKLAGWAPGLKKTIYLDKESAYDPENLKRVREVFLLKVYNWFLDGISVIELKPEERIQFEDILNDHLLYGGEIRYTRKKQGNKIQNCFLLVEAPITVRAKRIALAEIL